MRYLLTVALFSLLVAVWVQETEAQGGQGSKLGAVMVTTAKDAEVFSLSIKSALTHLVDVQTFYVVTPDSEKLSERMKGLGSRVVFVPEAKFNFTGEGIIDTMLEAVKVKGQYPLNGGKSQFEHMLYSKIGWFLQQLLKLYAGKVLDIEDFVLLDSDIIWYKDTKFISDDQTGVEAPLRRYLYTSSTQYHPSYISTMKSIVGVSPLAGEHKPGQYRSGVVHHLVISKTILNDLFATAENMHDNKPFWKIMLEQSAFEMTCHAPNPKICGGGSTLSEYEMYFTFARNKYPQTVSLRPLMWANGPMPGLIYTPDPTDPGPLLNSDAPKWKWSSRPHEKSKTLFMQMTADKEAGFDYVGYHSYAKRRYFELAKGDIETMCKSVSAPYNTSCAYAQLEERPDRNISNWFAGCACFMAKNFWG